MTLQDIETAIAPHALCIYGALHPQPRDVPEGIQTLVLLGPQEPGFWAHFTAAPEYCDARADPLDRWSRRVIGKIASDLDALPLFPFGGPPYQPFIRWALQSGRTHASPVGLLVHDTAGLWTSYRGALGIPERLELPFAPPNPCLTCDTQPCRTACPVGALAPENYNVAACKTDLDRVGNDCMARGCAARRACPVGQAFGRNEAQSAFHMEAFR